MQQNESIADGHQGRGGQPRAAGRQGGRPLHHQVRVYMRTLESGSDASIWLAASLHATATSGLCERVVLFGGKHGRRQAGKDEGAGGV